jgi:hypothetical protein
VLGIASIRPLSFDPKLNNKHKTLKKTSHAPKPPGVSAEPAFTKITVLKERISPLRIPPE